MGNKRLLSFDALKLFAIFLVLWGHCIQHLLSSDYQEEPVYRYIYAFHMPLFMMTSGYFALSSMKMGFKSFIKKKSVQLLLPCLSWALITPLITSVWITSLADANYHLYYLWFLKSCFCCYLLAYLAYRFGKFRPYALAVALIASQFILCFNVWYMFPCFILGMALKGHPQFMEWTTKKSPAFLILFMAMLLLWDERFWPFISVIDIMESQSLDAVLHTSFIWSYRLLTGLVGSVAFIGLFNLFDKKLHASPKTVALCSWGKYTLGIYILQSIILESWMEERIKLDELPPFVFNFIVSPLISIVLILVCVWIVRLINKNRYSALLLLGSEKAKP